MGAITILVAGKGDAGSSPVRELLSRLANSRYSVLDASTDQELMDAASSGRGSVVFLDAGSSGVSGYALLLANLRERAPDIPIIVFGDVRDEARAVDALRHGAQDYLARDNLDEHSLQHVIRSAIERQSVMGDLKRRAREFEASRARLLSLVSSNVDGIVVINGDQLVKFANPAAERMLSCPGGRLLGREFSFRIAPGSTREVDLGEESATLEMRAADTSWDGESACLVSIRDITARKHAEETLRKSEERYALAVKGTKDGLWDWDLAAGQVFYSAEWKLIVGHEVRDIGVSPEEWFGRVHEEDVERLRANIAEHLEGKCEYFENEHRLRHKDGEYRWVLSRGAAVRDATGRAVRLAGSQSDITERKAAEKNLRDALDNLKLALASEKVLLQELDKRNRELMELSITDGLTHLFNHRFIQDRLDFEFRRAHRYGIELSCMLIDIDHFKAVNDTYGHQFGDLVLRELAELIRKNSREVDICGRYGGEEFMVLTAQGAEGARTHAGKIQRGIETHVFTNRKHEIHVTVSIGIAEYRSEVKSKQELIERCDIALYRAKEDGRNLIRVWKSLSEEDVAALDVGGIKELTAKFILLSSEVRATYVESTNALLRAIDAKDHYTQEHSKNVSRHAVEIARVMGLSKEQREIVKYAGLLHDVGRIGIDKEILTKSTPLTEAELDLLKKHPEIGVSILKDVGFLKNELPVIMHHHERYDGAGYPQGLKGREIPLGAQIIAVADAYDAMTTRREYKTELSRAAAIEEIKRGSGTQFSPETVAAFCQLMENGESRTVASNRP